MLLQISVEGHISVAIIEVHIVILHLRDTTQSQSTNVMQVHTTQTPISLQILYFFINQRQDFKAF